MKKLIDYLKQPFPYFTQRWMIVAVTTLWIFVVFFTLRPFGLIYSAYQNHTIFYFTACAFISSAIAVYGFPLIFKKYYDPQQWTKGKFFLLSLSIILLMVFFILFYFILFKEKIPFLQSILQYKSLTLAGTLVLGSFPSIFFYFYIEKQDKKQTPAGADEPAQPALEDRQLTIRLPWRRGELKMLETDFVYAEVMGNNVSVFYLSHSSIKEESIRITLSQLMEELKEHPYIVRCHRAFIINVRCLLHIGGNSRGYSLKLMHTDKPLPATKMYIEEVRKQMQHYGRLSFTPRTIRRQTEDVSFPSQNMQ